MAKFYLTDHSSRTSAITKPTWITIGCMVALVLSCVFYVMGGHKYADIMEHSSTPIGSSITFSKSQAEGTLDGLYTDRKKNVLIARIGLEDSANQKLPYKGSDYTVFIKSPSVKGLQEVPILFGKMGTDGDLFLILPKPTNKIYSFAVINTQGDQSKISKLDEDKDRSLDNDNIDKGSVAKSLSQFTKEQKESGDSSADMGDSSGKVQNKYDMAGFRMTLDPAVDEDAYKPEVINDKLLDPDTGQFDFETFFRDVYVDTAVKTYTKRYNDLEAKKTQLKQSIKDAQNRLDMNPEDDTAAKGLSDMQESLGDVEDRQADYADKITYYQNLQYNPAMFQDFQDKAVVIK